DSIGGAAEIIATGVPAGLGEPVFDKLKADLAKALFSLPAVLGVEYGIGFGCVTMRGSQHNDIFTTAPQTPGVSQAGAGVAEPTDASSIPDAQSIRDASRAVPQPRIITRTNRHGGMLGGISTGMPIVLRAAVKPTSSLPIEQVTVTSSGDPTTI